MISLRNIEHYAPCDVLPANFGTEGSITQTERSNDVPGGGKFAELRN